MKKMMSAVVVALVILSLTGCRANNKGMNDSANQGNTSGIENRNNGVTDGGGNIGRASGTDNYGNAAGNYKDGAYIGFGNGHDNGIEKAIVMIRSGKIVDIYLTTVSQQDAPNFGNAANAGNNNEVGLSSGAVDEGKTNTLPGSGTNPGTGAGAAIGNTTGHELGGVKSELANAMIQNQRADVTISNNDSNARNSVENWKLAVSRALNQAGR
jgi:hypothetical protein